MHNVIVNETSLSILTKMKTIETNLKKWSIVISLDVLLVCVHKEEEMYKKSGAGS